MSFSDVLLGNVTLEQYFSNRNLARQFAREMWARRPHEPLHWDSRLPHSPGDVFIDFDLSPLIDELRKQIHLQQEILATVGDIKILMGDLLWFVGTQVSLTRSPRQTEAADVQNLANRAYSRGQYDTALNLFLQSEQLNPTDFFVLRSIATIYFFHKYDTKKALHYFKQAVIYKEPEIVRIASDACYWAGICYAVRHEWEDGLEQMTEAVQLDPTNWDAHYYRAALAALTGSHDLALDSLKIAIEGDSKNYERARADSLFSYAAK